MNSILPGCLTILFCTVCFYYSWRYHRNNHYGLALLCLLIAGATLRFYTAGDFFLHVWDERYHALVAKNMIHHPFIPTLYDQPLLPYHYQDWTSNHIWLHKQPLPLWIMGFFLWLFGNNELILRLPSILFTTLGIWLTYSIAGNLFNKRIGYLSAFFYSVNGLIIEMASGRIATDHIDASFLFFVELAVFFSVLFANKRKSIFNILAGISLGCAILSKWLPALVVLPLWLLVVLDSKNFSMRSIGVQFFTLLIICLAVFLPWQIYIYHAFPLEAHWEAGSNFRHMSQVLDGQTGPFYYYFDKIRVNYGELVYLPVIWYIWKIIQGPRDLKRLMIFTWFIIPCLFFSFAKTKMQGYILFTAPTLFIMTSDFFFMLKEKRIRRKWIIDVVLVLLIVLPVRYSIERIKPFEQRKRNPEWVADLKKLDARKYTNGVLFNYPKPIEAMFYTDLVAYPYLPGKADINRLIGDGRTVVIHDDGKIPAEVDSLKNVIKLHLITDN